MQLYKLTEELETAYQLLLETTDEETGEVNPDAVNLLKECQISFDDKVSSLVEMVARIDSDVEGYKKEEGRLKAHRQSLEKKSEWLKNYIKQNLIESGRNKIETLRAKVSLFNSRAVNVLNLNEIPEGYKVIETNVKVDKKAIAEAIKSGRAVAGAELIENVNLRIK